MGAPKAGTTSLFHYLRQHPRIFMPNKKEPTFFCGYRSNFEGPGSQGFNRNLVETKEEYLALFQDAKVDMLTGEASTDYLSCSEAPYRIKDWNSDAKIILVLRNPLDRAFSEHMHLIRDQFEKESFIDAMALEEERFERNFIPLFWHKKRGLYYQGVKNYIDLFGRDKVLILFFEQFVRSPIGAVKKVFEFLGLDCVPAATEKAFNVSGCPRLGFLQVLFLKYRRLPNDHGFKRFMHTVSVQSFRRKIMASYLRANIKKTEKLLPEERQKIYPHFREDIVALERLLKIDLTEWKIK